MPWSLQVVWDEKLRHCVLAKKKKKQTSELCSYRAISLACKYLICETKTAVLFWMFFFPLGTFKLMGEAKKILSGSEY